MEFCTVKPLKENIVSIAKWSVLLIKGVNLGMCQPMRYLGPNQFVGLHGTRHLEGLNLWFRCTQSTKVGTWSLTGKGD